MTRRPTHIPLLTHRRRAAAAALSLVAGALSGCSADFERARGAEGIFEAVRMQSGPPPRELAAMAVDPYDANNRYLGTAGLAGAYFAGGEAYLALFEDNADDPDAGVRSAALRGLGNHGEQRHAALLVRGLRDPDQQVRLEAARGLQRIHDPGVIPALLSAIRPPSGAAAQPGEEPDPDVRAEAAAALGQYAEARVVEGLIATLLDESLGVNRAALMSLRTLTGQDYGLDHEGWVGWRDRTTDADEMFRGRGLYLYPVFRRSRWWWEYLPLIPPPPNEVPATPVGLPRTQS
ncbi:MAG: HEAT repeat domain-containing protein [Phycisphaerales bacterium]